jgi:acyl-CoA thioester hydrolase
VHQTIVTLRSSVNTWECDENDHLNVQFYSRRFDEAARHFALTAEGGRADMALPVWRHLRYHKELRVAAPYHVESAVIGDGPFSGSAVHFMRHSETGQLAATAIDAPDGLAHADAIGHAEASEAHPRGIRTPPPTPLDKAAILARGGVMCYRGIVWPADCDVHGRMTEQHYMARSSDSAPHLWCHAGPPQSWFDTNFFGRAVIEARITRHGPAMAGDALVLHSSIGRSGARTLRLRHEMSRADNAAPVATIEVVSIVLDRKARKAAVLPEPFASMPMEA